jgi:hypothetical protein
MSRWRAFVKPLATGPCIASPCFGGRRRPRFSVIWYASLSSSDNKQDRRGASLCQLTKKSDDWGENPGAMHHPNVSSYPGRWPPPIIRSERTSRGPGNGHRKDHRHWSNFASGSRPTATVAMSECRTLVHAGRSMCPDHTDRPYRSGSRRRPGPQCGR